MQASEQLPRRALGARSLTTLLRLRLRLATRWSVRRYSRESRRSSPWYLAAGLTTAAMLLWALVWPAGAILAYLLRHPQDRLTLPDWLGWGASSAALLVFFYALITLLSSLTDRSDLRVLLLAPVSPRIVLGEKVLSTSLFASSGLLVMTPGLIGLARALHLGWPYLAMLLVVLLILPVPIVAIALILVVAVVRWSKKPARAKSATVTVGTLLFGLLYLGQQSLVLRGSGASATAVPRLPAWLPTTWPGHALAAVALGQPADAWRYLAGTVGMAAGLFAVAVVLAAAVFGSGVASYAEVGQRRTRTARREAPSTLPIGNEKPEPAARPWWPLLGKEWLILRRDPQRLAALVYPLFIIAFYLARTLTSPPAGSSGDPSDRFAGILSGSLYWMLTLTIIMLLNAMAPSIVNREGKSLYLLGVAPVDARSVFLAKWTICSVPILLLVEILLLIGSLANRFSAAQTAVSAVAMAAIVAALVAMIMAINLIWPHLDMSSSWQQTSVAASFTDLVAKVIIGGVGCILLILTFTLWPTWPAVAVVMAALYCLLTAGVGFGCYSLGVRRLDRLLCPE